MARQLYFHPMVQWQVPHMGCCSRLHGGGFLHTSFFQRTRCSRRAVCHPKRGQIPVLNANWHSHISAVSIWVTRPAECFCHLFYQWSGSQNFTVVWWWSQDTVPLPTAQCDYAEIQCGSLWRVFWLPLTTRTYNHSTHWFLTLLLTPGISTTV